MRTFIVISFLVAFILSVTSFGYQWRWFRPEFTLLLLIYWSMFAPEYFGLLSAWCVGLAMDLLALYPLGFHAMGTLLVSYIAFSIYRRIRNYILWHQAVWVFLLVAVFQLFSNWLGGFFGKAVDSLIFLIPAFLSALLWPLLVVVLGRLRIQFHLVD